MSKEWGTPTWTLLHTVAAKVNEEYFNKKGKELLSIILLIFQALPCPDCSYHSVSVFRKNKP